MIKLDHHRDRFATYARIVRHRLRRDAYRLCGDWHEADDLAQVTLCKIYRQWERLTQRDELVGYMRRTLLHAYISERRRLRWRCEIAHAEVPDDRDIEWSIEDRIVLLEAVNRLPPGQRAVVVLRFWEDLSIVQTATLLGCTAGTVTSQTHRALKTLRTMLHRP